MVESASRARNGTLVTRSNTPYTILWSRYQVKSTLDGSAKHISKAFVADRATFLNRSPFNSVSTIGTTMNAAISSWLGSLKQELWKKTPLEMALMPSGYRSI